MQKDHGPSLSELGVASGGRDMSIKDSQLCGGGGCPAIRPGSGVSLGGI